MAISSIGSAVPPIQSPQAEGEQPAVNVKLLRKVLNTQQAIAAQLLAQMSGVGQNLDVNT
jgi:hypothetical protein